MSDNRVDKAVHSQARLHQHDAEQLHKAELPISARTAGGTLAPYKYAFNVIHPCMPVTQNFAHCSPTCNNLGLLVLVIVVV